MHAREFSRGEDHPSGRFEFPLPIEIPELAHRFLEMNCDQLMITLHEPWVKNGLLSGKAHTGIVI